MPDASDASDAGGDAGGGAGDDAKADPKPRVAFKAFFWVVLSVGFLVYVVGIFNNLNAVRKIHGAYIRGFQFQKQCSDEYTEYESLRRHTYLAVKNERAALDAGAYMNLVLLFWIPVAVLLLLAGHMVGVSLGWTGALALALGYVAYVVSKRLLDPSAEGRLYQFFDGSYCDTPHTTPLTLMRRFQVFLAIVVALLVYAYYALHSTYENGTKTVYLNKFPAPIQQSALDHIKTYQTAVQEWKDAGDADAPAPDDSKVPFGYLLYQYARQYNYALYALVLLGVFAFAWVYLTSKQHALLRDRVLCHYEGLMEGYTAALEAYIYPETNAYATEEAYNRETEKRFTDIKDRMERTYLRIHGTMPVPNITEDNLGDYTIYLLNYRGREFEDLPESPELNRLREFMYRLRNDRVYQRTLEDYLQFSKRYLLFHFIVILYIVFHVLYQFKTIRRALTLTVGIGILAGLFVLSWYAWFDVALRV